MMIYYLKLYLITFSAFIVIDMVWLGFVARTFYQKHLGYIIAPSPNWIAAIIFYLLFIAGLIFFAVLPGLKDDSLKTSLLRAVMFGLITYGTYALTNLAVVKDWPVLVTVVDMIWGVVLSVIVCLVSLRTAKRMI
jgi:uncharacterized membrane protein